MPIRLRRRPEAGPALQIAAMIDVVFLLLIYFMVSSSIRREEADLGFQLPGVVEQERALELPDEQVVELTPEGRPVLNERALDDPAAPEFLQLRSVLTRFREACAANKVEAAVTIAPAPGTPHQAVIRVMDAAARAGIDKVNFSLGDDGEEGEG